MDIDGPRDLQRLVMHTLTQMEDYRLGESEEFGAVEELGQYLEENVPRTDNPDWHSFPYDTFHRTLDNHSDKEIRWATRLGLEMKLLGKELQNLPELREERRKENMEFLGEFYSNLVLEYNSLRKAIS